MMHKIFAVSAFALSVVLVSFGASGATALPDAYGPLLAASGITWIGGFAMFGLVSGGPCLIARTASS